MKGRPTHQPDPSVEARARASLNHRTQRSLSDEEWEHAKHAFLALFRLLQDWNHEDTAAVALNATPDTIPPNARHPDEQVLSLAIQTDSG